MLLLWSVMFDSLWPPQTAAYQAPLSTGFSRLEYWSGLQCPPPEDLPNPGTEPSFLVYPALAGGFFTTSGTWEAPVCLYTNPIIYIFYTLWKKEGATSNLS